MVQINGWHVLIVALVAWVAYRLLRGLATRRVEFKRELIAGLFFVYLCGVVLVTFFPINIILYGFDPHPVNLTPFVGSLRMLRQAHLPFVRINLLGNLALLAPLGIFLPLFFPNARRVFTITGLGFLVSLGIELLQLLLKVRIFDVDDLLLNTLGVLLGYMVFKLLGRIPPISRLVLKLSLPERVGQKRAFAAYSLFVFVAFLAICSAEIAQQTQTEAMILAELPLTQRQYLGNPKFDEFMFVFSQTGGGSKIVEAYRRVFFNRYTIFLTKDNLSLEQDTFSVSGTSFEGRYMNYFIIARSNKAVAAIASRGARFPVVQAGEYYFAYARFPMQEERYFSFSFVDAQGNDLRLSQEH